MKQQKKSKPKPKRKLYRREKSDAEKQLDNLRRRFKRTERGWNFTKSIMKAHGFDFEARKRENRKRAAEMGLTPVEYGLLSYAYAKAELSAKPDETLEQTVARAREIWKEEVQKHKEEEERMKNAIISLPEKHRRALLSKFRRTEKLNELR